MSTRGSGGGGGMGGMGSMGGQGMMGPGPTMGMVSGGAGNMGSGLFKFQFSDSNQYFFKIIVKFF